MEKLLPPNEMTAPWPATWYLAFPPVAFAPPITTYALLVPSNHMALLTHATVLPGVNVQLPADPVSVGELLTRSVPLTTLVGAVRRCVSPKLHDSVTQVGGGLGGEGGGGAGSDGLKQYFCWR